MMVESPAARVGQVGGILNWQRDVVVVAVPAKESLELAESEVSVKSIIVLVIGCRQAALSVYATP